MAIAYPHPLLNIDSMSRILDIVTTNPFVIEITTLDDEPFRPMPPDLCGPSIVSMVKDSDYTTCSKFHGKSMIILAQPSFLRMNHHVLNISIHNLSGGASWLHTRATLGFDMISMLLRHVTPLTTPYSRVIFGSKVVCDHYVMTPIDLRWHCSSIHFHACPFKSEDRHLPNPSKDFVIELVGVASQTAW